MNRELKIIFTSDTHGHVFPINYASNMPENSGLLSIAAQIQKDGNTLVIDGGDSLQGTPLMGYYLTHAGDYAYHPVAEGFKAMKCDYYTLGNHDFNFGYDAIKDYINNMDAECICANVIDKRGELRIAKSTVRVLENGMKVGIAGAVTDFVNVWESAENLSELEVTEPIEALKSELQKLKEECDITVCIYHGGFEKDFETGRRLSKTRENVACEICEKLDFDIVLTGHQHMSIGSVDIDGSHAAQPADQAREYVSMKALETADGYDITSELVKTGSEYLNEPCEKMQEIEKNVQVWLDEIIGEIAEEIKPEEKLDAALHGSRLASLFNAIQLEFSGADFSCTSLGNEALFLPQKISIRDVSHVYPFANTVDVLEVIGKTIKESLERCASYFDLTEEGPKISDRFLKPKVEHYNYDFWAGISYEFDLRNDIGNRVVKLCRLNGEEIDMDAKYTLVASNYRSTGTGGYDAIGASEVIRSSTEEMPDLMIEFIKKHTPIGEIKNSELKVIW